MSLEKGQTSAISMILISGIVLAMVVATYQWGVPLVNKSQTNSKIVQAEDALALIKQRINDVALSGGQKSFSVNLDGTLEISPSKNSVIYSVSTTGLGIGSFSYISLDSSSAAMSYDMYAVAAADGGIVAIDGIDYNVSKCSANSGVLINDSFRAVGGTIHPGAPDYAVEHVDCQNSLDGFTVISGPEKELVGILGSDDAGVVMARTNYDANGYKTQFRLMYRELDDPATRDAQKIIIRSEGNSFALSGAHKITVRQGNVERVPFGARLGGDTINTIVYVSIS